MALGAVEILWHDALLGGYYDSPETALALTSEAARPSQAGEFYGHITYGSVVATKPRSPR